MIALFIGLGIALLWGLADILSSHVTISSSRSTVIAQGSGMLVLLLCGMVVPMGEIEMRVHSLSETLSLLMGLGVLGGLGYLSLYRAFQSVLPVGLVSALVTGSYAVSTLASWLLFRDVNLASVLLLLCGVMLVAGSAVFSSSKVARVDISSLTPQVMWGIVWAMAAALCLGVFNFGLGLSSGLSGAWYVLLLGSRALSLLLLAFMLAGSQDNGYAGQRKNWLLSVGVGVTEMGGLLLLSYSAERSLSHLTLILAISSCSVLLPFGYSISRGMRVQRIHLISLFLILFGLITLKDGEATSLSTTVLVLLVLSLVLWGLARGVFPAMRDFTGQIALEPVRLFSTVSLKETIMPNLSSQTIAPEKSSITPALDQHEGDTQRRWYQRLLIPGPLFLLLLAVLLPSLLVPDLAFANLAQASVGTVSFTSSGQLDPGNTRGIEDGLAFSLRNLPSLSAGRAYYLWLLSDVPNDEGASLLVGTISKAGTTSVLFTTPDHQNLLLRFSRVLMTQQASTPIPLVPQMANALYQGAIPNIPAPNDPKHYSLLDHLRHLLATDPTLSANGLAGGLSTWLSRNAGKVLEWSQAARDSWTGMGSQQSDLIRRHMIRILDALDGITYAYQDVPQGSPFLADPQASHFGLLSLFQTQDPPGLLPHVAWHIQGVLASPGRLPEQDQIVQKMLPEFDKAAHHLQTVREDAKKLVGMSNDQLMQQTALALMNDLVTNAMAAFVGEPNTTGTTVGGITWIEGQVKRLAVMPINPV